MLPTVIYDQVKYWLPLASGFVLAYKGFKSIKKSIDGWAETHLRQIAESATAAATTATKTVDLLEARTSKFTEIIQRGIDAKNEADVSREDILKHVVEVKADIKEHGDKETAIWMGVINTLSLLEDRSRSATPKRRTPRRR